MEELKSNPDQLTNEYSEINFGPNILPTDLVDIVFYKLLKEVSRVERVMRASEENRSKKIFTIVK